MYKELQTMDGILVEHPIFPFYSPSDHLHVIVFYMFYNSGVCIITGIKSKINKIQIFLSGSKGNFKQKISISDDDPIIKIRIYKSDADLLLGVQLESLLGNKFYFGTVSKGLIETTIELSTLFPINDTGGRSAISNCYAVVRSEKIAGSTKEDPTETTLDDEEKESPVSLRNYKLLDIRLVHSEDGTAATDIKTVWAIKSNTLASIGLL